jgi:hypothetical protein
MNEVPPSQDSDDEVDDLYRRASALDPSRPSESVRRKVLEHAAQLAAERAAANRPAKISFARWSYRSSWRPAIFGTLAAAALAGLLFAPEFLMPHGPGTTLSTDQAPVLQPIPATEAPAADSAPAPAPARVDAAQAPAAQLPAAPAPEAAVNRIASRPAPPGERRQYAADEPSVSASREQAQSTLKPRASARNAATVADSAAPIAAKNAPTELQGVTTTQSAAASATAGAGAAIEEPRARLGASTAITSAVPPAAPAARESTGRTEVTAGRGVDPAAALRRAAEIGDVAKLQALLNLQSESAVDARDEDGRTALMLATLHGRAHAVNVLLAHGADPNVADARGTTPLQAALAGHQTAIAAALQLAGARAQ